MSIVFPGDEKAWEEARKRKDEFLEKLRNRPKPGLLARLKSRVRNLLKKPDYKITIGEVKFVSPLETTEETPSPPAKHSNPKTP